MKMLITYRLVLLMVVIILGASCKRVIVTVESIPGNTPSGQPIYVVGNFNNWDPGDERYRMQMNPDSTYGISLPPGFGTIEYKFTRGDWTTVEKDLCGYEIDHRRIAVGSADTLRNTIDSWNDLAPLNCPRLTLVVNQVPGNTKPDELISVVGNFNGWTADSLSAMKKDSMGNYSLTIGKPAGLEEIEFKLTRGDLSSAESDEFWNMVPNRIIRFGERDTFELKIEGWIDRPGKMVNRVVIMIDKLPPGTSMTSELYLASSMNGWKADDKNYLFMLNKDGQLYYPLPRKKRPVEFKITRGDWNTVEVDKYGYDITNRFMVPEEEDTVHIEIDGWKDMTPITDFEVTLVIDELPQTTPSEQRLFVSGNFNRWRFGKSKYSFSADASGRQVLNLTRDKGLLEFKIHRGAFESIEVSKYGNHIHDRSFYYKDVDTIYIAVQNWLDLPPLDIKEITLVLEKLPEETPPLINIFLAPDFNGWDPGAPKLVFRSLPDGRPYFTVKIDAPQFEYKITRGSWDNVEADSLGDPIPNRVQTIGFTDTVYLEVALWRDMGGRY